MGWGGGGGGAPGKTHFLSTNRENLTETYVRDDTQGVHSEKRFISVTLKLS